MKKTLLSLAVVGALSISANAFTLGKLGDFEFKKYSDNLYICQALRWNQMRRMRGL